MSSACNAGMMSSAMGLRRMSPLRIALAALVLLVLALQGSTTLTNDSPFILMNKATGFCLAKRGTRCTEIRWTTSNRLFVVSTKKCLGAQGKSVGSEVSQYDCDENSDLQKWDCQNGTLLTLKDQPFYIEVKTDESVVLSKTVGPNNHLTIAGTSSGACTRTHREYYTIGGNSFGKICMFPFMYKDRWFGDCTTYDSKTKRSWCATETKYQHEQWGYCPSSSTEHWNRNIVTGAYYQVNMQSALTWAQADASCKQQAAFLVSIVDPIEKAFITGLTGTGRNKLWIGLSLGTEHGWQWTDGKPFRYMKWDAGHPLPNPGHNCALLDTAGQFSWQSSTCTKKLGYICYKGGTPPAPPRFEDGLCPDHWIPYNGHCFYLQRTPKSWSSALTECRKEGSELVNIRNIEDQSFVISQLGYASTDELWIGLNDRTTEGLFDWSDHTTVTFTSWEPEEPTVSTDEEDCVLMKGENGNWADRSCDEKHGYICMKQSATDGTGDVIELHLDAGCKIGWRRHGSFCYFVGTETKTFDEAKEDCQSSASYLADVSNGVDNAFLVSLVGLRPEKHFWIGLSNQNNLDIFSWTNTEFVRFTHWNSGMPGNQQGCVAMATGVLAGLWDILPCTNKEKYICKCMAEGVVSTVPPQTQTPPQCPDGWNRVGTRSVCAKFFTGPRSEEKTWFEARDYCRAIGGDLLSIHSSSELMVAREPYLTIPYLPDVMLGSRLSHFHVMSSLSQAAAYRGGKAWIGLHFENPNGYVWTDGSALNFQHWQEGEPNNFNNDESCTEFVMYNWDEQGSWNDLNCESYNDWLCQIQAGATLKPPPNNTAAEFNTTSDGWLIWKGRQYYLNRMAKSMEEARDFCKRRHGDLVVINNKEENIFLWKQISRSYGSWYIGLSVDLDGSFWWLDDTPVSYQRWDENQPNSNAFDENCVMMGHHMGYWRTSNCGREAQSICERSNSPPVNTTAAPTVSLVGGCMATWKKFGSKCYKIVSDRKVTWEDARTQCANFDAKLVSIPTRQVQAFLITKMLTAANTDLWIGLNSLSQDGFFWSDGKTRQYTNWGYSKNQRRPGSFYQRWNEEECVLMSSSSAFGIGKWLIKSCNDTNGFICHKDLNTAIKDNSDPISPTTYESLGNDSIKAVTQNLTWAEAKKSCENDKANLASLRTEWTNAYVELLALTLKTPLWIGLNKDETKGYFRFIDGWHLSTTNWAEFEPSRNKPCVYIDVDGKWRTAFCNQTMNSVCMMSTDVPPTESAVFPGRCPEDTNVEYQDSYTWLPYKGNCYLFVTDEIEWADAASSCVRHGGVLTSIEDPMEQAFLHSNIQVFQDSHISFWVGLFKTHRGSWAWLDKTLLDYVNWGEDEPDSDFGAITTKDGTWSSGRRWHDRSYICKTPKVMLTDAGQKPNPQHRDDPHSRVHTSLVVAMLIAIISIMTLFAFLLYKRSPRPFPTFDNPLYFNGEKSQPDVVDTNKLIENAEVSEISPENPEPILIL
ncbi:macrophage mannose receptor 1-like isoform X1 [Poecilia latipinna]|uniref:macrophage mannose receptor 1-like isoform X1 n=2 Tax=Poecilia latipinna TaxID=48699 RepID=UPI00072E6FEE|nr:PREDICTED: macrophage mannose receptor 1-like isoform X1 [Poecilia latipinna]